MPTTWVLYPPPLPRFSDLPPALQVAVAYNKVREISTRRHRCYVVGSVHRIVQRSDYLMVAHFAVLEVIEWGGPTASCC